MSRLADWFLEFRIRRALKRWLRDKSKWADVVALVKRRSSAQVKRMESRMGLE